MYKNPIPVVDAIIERDEKILLIKRDNEPFKGMFALPGGFVEQGETVEQATVREAFEETSLKIEVKEILGVYSDPNRNPLRHTLAVVFVADIIGGEVKANSDASEARWFDLNEIDFDNLAFDHAKIIKDFIEWKSNKGTFWTGK